MHHTCVPALGQVQAPRKLAGNGMKVSLIGNSRSMTLFIDY